MHRTSKQYLLCTKYTCMYIYQANLYSIKQHILVDLQPFLLYTCTCIILTAANMDIQDLADCIELFLNCLIKNNEKKQWKCTCTCKQTEKHVFFLVRWNYRTFPSLYTCIYIPTYIQWG